MRGAGVMASAGRRTRPQMPVNLLTAQQASMETGTTTGFMSDASTLAVSQARAVDGTWSLGVTQTAVNPNLLCPGPMAVGAVKYQPFPATPSQTFTVMAWVWTDTAGRIWGWQHQSRTATGGFLGTATSVSNTALAAGAWTPCRRTFVTNSDPTTAGVTVWWQPRGLSDGETVTVDKLGLFAGDVPVGDWVLPTA